MAGLGQVLPLGAGSPFQTNGNDLLVNNKQFPGIVLYPIATEQGGLYTVVREINGALWQMVNADFNANGFVQINPAVESSAMALQAGGWCIYTAPPNSPPGFTWTTVFCVGASVSINRALPILLSGADFTPSVVGLDIGSIRPVIYNPFAPSNQFPKSVSYSCAAIYARLETPSVSGSTSISIARYTGTGNFTTTNLLNTSALIVPSGQNEAILGPTGIALPSVNSNDKLGVVYNAIGTGISGVTVYVVLTAVF